MRIWLSLTCAFTLAACAASDPGTVAVERHRKDAGVTTVDAPVSTGGTAGTVSCYSEGDPGATCTLPVHCCFGNYSSQHDGGCSTNPCSFEITCDGPEDCAAGSVCCSHETDDTYFGVTSNVLACQVGGCAAGDREICHPATGCSTGASCVTAYGNDNDLPRTLYVCQ